MKLKWIQYFFQASPDHGYAGRQTGDFSDPDTVFTQDMGEKIKNC